MTKTKQRKKASRKIHAQMHDSIIRLRSRIKALKRLYYKTGQEWYWVEREECKKDLTKLYEEMVKFEAENADFLKQKHRPHIDKSQYEQKEQEKLEWSDDFKRTVQKIEESIKKSQADDIEKAKQERREMVAYGKKISATKKTARKFLQDAGIADKDGKLKILVKP